MQSLPRVHPFPRGAGAMTEGATKVALDDRSEIDETVRALLVDVLGLAKLRVARFDDETELFGALPEFDSMAVATLLTEMEERLGILIEDEDVEAEDLMTFGRLMSFAKRWGRSWKTEPLAIPKAPEAVKNAAAHHVSECAIEAATSATAATE